MQECIERNDRRVEALNLQAFCYKNEGDLVKAYEVLQEALESNEKRDLSLFNLGSMK